MKYRYLLLVLFLLLLLIGSILEFFITNDVSSDYETTSGTEWVGFIFVSVGLVGLMLFAFMSTNKPWLGKVAFIFLLLSNLIQFSHQQNMIHEGKYNYTAFLFALLFLIFGIIFGCILVRYNIGDEEENPLSSITLGANSQENLNTRIEKQINRAKKGAQKYSQLQGYRYAYDEMERSIKEAKGNEKQIQESISKFYNWAKSPQQGAEQKINVVLETVQSSQIPSASSQSSQILSDSKEIEAPQKKYEEEVIKQMKKDLLQAQTAVITSSSSIALNANTNLKKLANLVDKAKQDIQNAGGNMEKLKEIFEQYIKDRDYIPFS
jgi:hypothetical protein